MTSSSSLGSTNVTLQFDLNRNIDAAARDVQAAINAARGQLPANLPNNPTYRKVNPADAPIMILALTSELVEKPRMYDVASSILQQKIAQIEGVGQVTVGGGALPAVRVELNPTALNDYGLGLEDVRTALGERQRQPPEGRAGQRQSHVVAQHHRSALQGRGVPAADRQPIKTAPRCGCRDLGRRRRLGGRRAATAASRTASPRFC